jgi:hypothetical protein
MATSYGEAIGSGLERGLALGFGIRDRERMARRQEEQDAFEREDRAIRMEDRNLRLADRQRSLEDRDRMLERQKRADRLAALQAQGQQVAAEMAALPPGDTSPRAAELTARSRALRQAESRELAAAGGIDFEAQAREVAADVDAVRAGRGGDLPPARRARAIVAVTGRPLSDFFRVGGQPSKVGAAIEDFKAGLAGSDYERMLRGTNVVLAPDLARGIGKPSPHGGVIVAKEVAAFDRVPDSDPDDPQMVPRLRVWVKEPLKSDEDKRLVNRWRAANPGAPEGATGFYYAPATKDGDSRPDSPVTVLGMRRGMQYLDSLAKMEEWANHPKVAADLAAGLGQFDQQAWLSERAARGLAPKLTTKEHTIPADGSLLRVTTDQQGKEVGRELITSPTTKKNPELEQARISVLMAQQTALAALAGLRTSRQGSGDHARLLQQAKFALSKLTAEGGLFKSEANRIAKLMETAGPTKQRELQPQLDAANEEARRIAGLIAELEIASNDASPAKSAGLGAAPAAGSKPTKPAAPARIKMDANGNVVQ